MKIQMTTKEFRQLVESNVGDKKDQNLIFEYLIDAGYIVHSRGGIIEVDENLPTRMKEMLGKIKEGDIAWIDAIGMVFVFDQHPHAESDEDDIVDDNHHFRAIKVMYSNGTYAIHGDSRSYVVSDRDALRICHSSIDPVKVKQLTHERYEMISRILEINKELDSMKEEVCLSQSQQSRR